MNASACTQISPKAPFPALEVDSVLHCSIAVQPLWQDDGNFSAMAVIVAKFTPAITCVVIFVTVFFSSLENYALLRLGKSEHIWGEILGKPGAGL